MSSTKLYRVATLLTAEKFHIDVHEWDAIEKELIYWVSRRNQWDELLKRRIKKDRIGRVDHGEWTNNLQTVQYQAWCYEKDIEEMKTACTGFVIKAVERFKANLDALLKNLPTQKSE